MIGYAVARFSVLYPNEHFGFSDKSTENLMRKVFLVPIFQLFGESFVEKPEDVGGKGKENTPTNTNAMKGLRFSLLGSNDVKRNRYHVNAPI